MHILSVKDPAFRKYGRVITNVDFTQLVEEMKKTPVPDGVVYEPGINALEALPVKKELETITYGEMPVQIGYCNGHNSKLNAVEYHRSSEINVAATDAILILGLLADVAESEEGPAMGGAMLAAVACGEYASVEEIAEKFVKVTGTVEPDPELVAKYEDRYQKFRQIYPACKPLFEIIK